MTSNGDLTESNNSQKSVLRKRLEELESDIYHSWLKDQDKVKELLELNGILDRIYHKASIEEFFENQSDFEYFCKKFSAEIINNILKQPIIFGTNGDEIALNVLFSYLRIFYKFMEKSQYQNLWESIREIFDSNKHYYKGTVYGNNRNFNEKKLMSAEKYNEMRLPRKNVSRMEISEGMILDILTDCKRQTTQQMEKKVWVRGKVSRLESEYFVVFVSEDPYPIFMKYNSFEYAPAGTMTKDWEWRSSIQPNTNIDCYDRGKWYPATVLFRKEDEMNGVKKVDYRIGFRIYPEYQPEWEKYKKFWPMKDLSKDSSSRIYLGDVENLDEWIPAHSKRVQKFNTVIYNEPKNDSFDNENYFIDNMVKFIDENGRKTYTIGRNNGFNYYFALMLNYFCEMGGFDKMVKSLLQRDEARPSPELIHNIFYILNVSSGLLHKDFVIELGQNLYENIFNYLNSINQNELRNIKKDTFELITKVLRFYLGISLGSEIRNQVIEQFSLTFAIKMMKTSFLEKRITAIKTIIDVIKSSKNDKEKRTGLLKIIEDNQVFYEIYGSNSHIQLINKSKDLLEIMLQEDRLSDGEMEMIWGATKKGDLEGKLTILRILKEISKSLQPKHIKVLLDNIYSSKFNELVIDEIDLIYELSTHVSQNDEILEKCIKFFTSCLLENRTDEGEKIEILINKIFEITKLNPSFKISVINMTIDCLENNNNVNLAIKILSKYLRESDLQSDYDINRLLIENSHIVKLYKANFINYIHYVKEKCKNWIQDIDLLPLRDNFNHTQNIKSRLMFLNTLLSLKVWVGDETSDNGDPIEFIYRILIEEGSVSDKDKYEFFNWIKNLIDSNVDSLTEEKIFKLFNQKLCKDAKSCQYLSIEAFDTYLRVFLNINSQNSNLRYMKIPRENTYELDVYVEPEKLIGFEILWKIVFESFSRDIMNKGIETLHSIFTNVQISVVNKNSESYSQLLLKKCLNLIKETTIRDCISYEEKCNVITKCFLILRLMIEESEKRGTAGIKSHAAIRKRRIINLKITSNIGFLSNREFNLRVYGNTTVWELKELITMKLAYCFDFLRITLTKNNYELKNTDNGKTLLDLGLQDGDTINCIGNGLEKLIPQSEIQVNGVPTDEIHAVFNDWFDRFATTDKMSKEDCCKFIKAVTNTREEINVDDHRINFLFGSYDRNKDNFLEKDEFTQFYLECTSKPDKRKIVWENLKSMGVRNDLKKMSDPYQIYNEDEKILPRYQLSHNDEFFNTIFYLQDLTENIAKEAFNFLCLISTNPNIYQSILNSGDCESTDWNVILNEFNIYKLIYSLQIIESFLEDIEMNSSSAFVDNVDKAEIILNQNKFQWMKNFIEKGGYSHLVNILQKKLLEKKEITSNYLMNNICIEFLLKIVKIFYFSSLNKFDTYKKVVSTISVPTLTKQLSGLSVDDDSKKLSKGSIYFDSNVMQEYLSGLDDFIVNSLDHNALITNLLELSFGILSKVNKTKEEVDIINTSFEFLTVIIPYAPQPEDAQKIVLANKNFVNICLYGLLNESLEIRVIFSNSLIKLCKLLQSLERFELIIYLFLHIFELIENISQELEKNSNEVFEFFSYLLEIYLNESTQFNLVNNSAEINPKKFLKRMLENLDSDINEDTVHPIRQINLSNELFIGYMKIVTKIAESNDEIKNLISENYNLLQGVLTKVLFKQSSAELNDKLSTFNFINPDKVYDTKSNRNSNQTIRNVCYNFVQVMLKNSIDNFERFFSVNVLESEEKKQEKNEQNENNMSRYFSYSNQGRNEGFVGIKNLGCICYMNAMMQQFFMVPSLRYSLLRADDGISTDCNNMHKVDDNSLHQVQKLFSYLELSERMDYNPFGFCFSFKDWEGNPTNTSIQQDSQEFLSRFLDVIENQVKPTPLKYVFQSIFGGKTCTQLICEQGCGNATNRFEDFYTLSLEVNNMKTLNDSLEKLISPEKIDEYNCDTCKRKVTITKRSSLATLPNVLIVHLQRLFYNYELDRNEKINSRLEFPKVLNLKDFCVEEITRRGKAKSQKSQEESDDKIDTDDVYFKHPSYYEYHLVGVIVHMGSADAGHYYSYINTVRGGTENEAFFNPKDDLHMNSWLEFNDSYISKFNISKLEDECYGGSYDNDKEKMSESSWGNFNRGEKSKSAYMLVYERRIKSSIKMVASPSSDCNLLTFKEDECSKIKKQFDLFRYIDTPEYSSIKEKIYSTTFYDAAKNEYFTYAPFYMKERLIPKNYYLSIMEDNSLFQKHQNTSDERFVSFFDNVIYLLDEAMSNVKLIKQDTSAKISITFMNFIFNILSQKDKQQLLTTAREKFLHILDSQPLCMTPVWEYINNNLKQLREILLNENENIVSNNCDLLSELIKKAYHISPEEFVSALKKNEYEENVFSYVKKTLDFIISFFPRIPNKFLNKIAPIVRLLYDVSFLCEEMYEYFSSNEIIFVFVTFMLGKESPCYSETIQKPSDNWDIGRNSISGVEPMIQLIYQIFIRSRENRLLEIEERQPTCILTQRDLKCLKNPAFLKFTFKNCDSVFSGLLVHLNYEDDEFTLQSCTEITRYIDEVYAFNGHDFVKLFNGIIPLLELKDAYQRNRFEIIIGIPQMTIDDSCPNYAFPLIGYHNIGDQHGKFVEHKGVINLRNMCSVIKKMFILKLKETFSVEIFLTMLEACVENHELLKYIRKMPGEEPAFDDFVEWGVALVNLHGKSDSNIYHQKLKKSVEKINLILNDVINDNNILKGFKGFMGKYLIKDIKREEISLIACKDNIYIFQLEYIANTVPLNTKDFSKSKSYLSGNVSLLEDDEKIHEESDIYIGDKDNQNLKEIPDDVQLISADTKLNLTEREFFKKVISNFSTYNKIIVENKNYVLGATSILKRFIVFNNSMRDANIDFTLRRLTTPNPDNINEYVPSSSISCFSPSQMIRNVYVMAKLNIADDWCEPENFDYELEVDYIVSRSNYSYNAGGYSAVTNTPTTEYINYTQYASYGRSNYNAGGGNAYDQAYAALEAAPDVTGSQGIIKLIKGEKLAEIEDENDDDDEYGRNL